MRKLGIIVLIIIVGVIAAYAGLQVNSASIAPPLSDTPKIGEDVKITINEASQINDEGFYIDEEGVKHYVISGSDNLKVGE